MPMEFNVHEATDSGPARWVNQTVTNVEDAGRRVTSIVPTGFEKYARLLHPPYQRSSGRRFAIRWADISSVGNLAIGPNTGWAELVKGTRSGNASLEEPSEGHLPYPEIAALMELLYFYTTTPQNCWFAVWEGFAALASETRYADAARVDLRKMKYILLRGPIQGARLSFAVPPGEQGPNVWWPDDRAWCVVSDVDMTSTYIAGTAACVESVLSDARLETMLVSPADPLPSS